MKFLKSFVKTFLFCSFMTIIVSTTGDTVIQDFNNELNSLSAFSEEYPNTTPYDSGH